MLISYLYSFFSAFLIGLQLFLVSYINHINKTIFNVIFLITIILLLLIISRIFVYYASKKLNITIIHSILNTSILFTLLLSKIIYNTQFDLFVFLLGFILLFLGVRLVSLSIHKS